MNRIAILNLAVLISIVVILSPCSAKDKQVCQQPLPSMQPAKTVENRSVAEDGDQNTVALEAYLVQVNMEALYKAGIKPIPVKGAEQITADMLLNCISEPNNGKVVRMDKMTIKEGRQANNSSNQKYFKHIDKINIPGSDHTSENIQYKNYQTGCSIDVDILNVKEKQIFLQIALSYSGYDDEPTTKDDVQPNSTSYNFKGELIVTTNDAVVVGGMQNGNKGLFLVVRATLMSRN